MLTKLGMHPKTFGTPVYRMTHPNGLYPKFEEKPVNGQNKTLSMFLDDTACPFHSAIESGICSNFMEFGQNCNF